MKLRLRAISIFFLTVVMCAIGLAQTVVTKPGDFQPVTTITMPTYVAGGVSFNQLGNPRTTAWVSGLVPVAQQMGVYESTTTDIIPAAKVDPTTKRTIYTLSFQIRQGMHKTLYTGNKVQLLIGGDAGASFSQNTDPAGVSVSGMGVNLAASVTGTFVYQISQHFAVIFPIRAMYVSTLDGWNPIVQAGVVWKP